jgi:hypothetical protein
MRDAKRRGLLFLSWSLLIPAVVLGQDQARQPRQPAARGQHTTPAIAQAGNWLVPAPKPGTPIRVIQGSGESTTGRLVSVLPSAIRLISDGITREVPLTEITVVRRNGDPLWNGIAWGGGITGALFLGYNGDCDTCYSAAELALFRLAMAGAGAGVGALLDLMVRDKRVLYQAPSTRTASVKFVMHPVVAGHARALLVSARW